MGNDPFYSLLAESVWVKSNSRLDQTKEIGHARQTSEKIQDSRLLQHKCRTAAFARKKSISYSLQSLGALHRAEEKQSGGPTDRDAATPEATRESDN
jgi:hypothetical protein